MDWTDPKTWTDGIAVVSSAPHIVVPLIFVLVAATWWIRGTFAKVSAEGLRSQNETLKERLSLAQDRQSDFQEKLAALQAEFATHKQNVERRAAPSEIEATATATATLLGDLAKANSALKRSLTLVADDKAQGAIDSVIMDGLIKAHNALIAIPREELSFKRLSEWQADATTATRLAHANGINLHNPIAQHLSALQHTSDIDVMEAVRNRIVAMMRQTIGRRADVLSGKTLDE
jgi:hypothetical protein